MEALVRLSSLCLLLSSQMALTPATTTTNVSAAVDPVPPNGETVDHQDRQA